MMTNETITAVAVDPKADLAEVMATVETRKTFYKKALKSLQAIYEIEKKDRESVKVAKVALASARKSSDDTQVGLMEIAVKDAQESLVETMAMVFARKKFFNRAAKSLQSIYEVEKTLRSAIKTAKAMGN